MPFAFFVMVYYLPAGLSSSLLQKGDSNQGNPYFQGKFMPQGIVRAGIVIIGNEVLSGRTQDTNLNYLAIGLGEIGIRVAEARVIPDIEAVIVETVNSMRQQYDYVFTTGGIGPTHDDITSASIAKAFGVKLVRHKEAEAILHRYYKPEDRNEARMKMADTPEGASLILNPVSAAPGFCVGNVYVMAGVPRIMQAMFDSLKHELKQGKPVVSHEIAAYMTEGSIAKPLGEIQALYPEVDIGSYPFIRDKRLGTSLVVRSDDKVALEKAYTEVKAMVEGLGVEVISS